MQSIFSLSRIAALLVATAILGWLDYVSGPDIAFSLFYLIPVVIAAWVGGVSLTVLLAFTASTAWFVADYLWHHTTVAVSFWNTFTRFSIFIAIGVLISNLRRNLTNLERANEQLESFNRSVSHDLRSPLIHVVRYSELLSERLASDDEDAGRYLATISSSATDGLKLIDDLLRFAQMYSAEIVREVVSLDRLVEKVRGDLASETHGRTIHWRIESLPPVKADAAMVQIAVRNLLENAVKYTGTREEAIIEISGAEVNDSVVVTIRDNGVGFDPKYRHKLFHVFERLHRESEFEGTGIGLAIVREVIVRHGGRVWAEAERDVGATFHFSLPRS